MNISCILDQLLQKNVTNNTVFRSWFSSYIYPWIGIKQVFNKIVLTSLNAFLEKFKKKDWFLLKNYLNCKLCIFDIFIINLWHLDPWLSGFKNTKLWWTNWNYSGVSTFSVLKTLNLQLPPILTNLRLVFIWSIYFNFRWKRFSEV